MIITDRPFDCIADMDLAKEVGDILTKTYPGWLWAVEINDHCPIIRLLNAPVRGACMVINRKDLYSASDTKKLVIMSGGEMLERCNKMAAGMREGDHNIKELEGAPDKLWAITQAQRDKL